MKPIEKLTEEEADRLALMFEIAPMLADAYRLKNEFLTVIRSKSAAEGKQRLVDWLFAVEVMDLPEFHDCTKAYHNWFKEILNSMDVPWSNGFIEGCNNKTKVLKRVCFGMRNFRNFRNRIYNTAERWTDGVLYIDNWLIEAKNTVSGDYVVASGTTGIADGAFYDCQSLMSLTISDGVTSLGRETVICSSLAEINVAEDNTVYASENGVLFDKAKTALLVYPAGKTEAEYVIPESVTSIGEGAFWCSSNLRNVTIPDSVTSIGDSAFECSGLTSVTIGNGVTSIGNNVFEGCSSLTSVTIGNGVTSIGDLAFCNCDNLQEAYFLGNAPVLGVDAFMTWSIETQAYIIIPGLTIYYLEEKDGWESPAWKDYPTSTWQE